MRSGITHTQGTRSATYPIRYHDARSAVYSLQRNHSHAAPRPHPSLDAHAANAPTMADTQEQMDADRAIPPFDLTATEPANVYKYDDLITPAEYEALRCVALATLVGS